MAELRDLTRKLDALLALGDGFGAKLYKKTLSTEAAKAKRAAQKALLATGISNAKALRGNIRGKMLKDYSGIIAAANERGKKYLHRNRRGKLVPVARWLNDGLDDRWTKGANKYRGRFEGLHFMDAAEEEMKKTEVRLVKTFEDNVDRFIEKYLSNG